MNRRVSDILQVKSVNHSRQTYESLSPLTWLLNIFATNSNVINNTISCNAFYITKSFITFMVLGSLIIISLLYKNLYIYKHTPIAESIKLLDTAQMVYDLIQYFVDLWFVFKYGRHISLEYIKQYEHIDAFLGMKYYGKIKLEIIRLLSFFTFIWLTVSVTDFLSWAISYGLITPTAYSIVYLFLYIKILTSLDLSSHVIQIRFRLMLIGDIVHDYFSFTESLPGFMSRYFSSENCLYGTIRRSSLKDDNVDGNAMKLRSSEDCKEVNLLARCYLHLTEQVAHINNIFGIRILLNTICLVIDMIRFTNIAARIVLGTQNMPNESRYFPAVSSIMRQMTCVLVFVSLVNQCNRVYRQEERIISTIDHLLIDKNPSDQLRIAMTELRGLMRARPITFSLANFFRLDNSLLVSIASVVVTYTIILLQSMN